jgi:hypothetical protein
MINLAKHNEIEKHKQTRKGNEKHKQEINLSKT